MPHNTNNPIRKSWIEVPKNSDFPIQNIPFGVFLTKEDVITIGTRIGDYAITPECHPVLDIKYYIYSLKKIFENKENIEEKYEIIYNQKELE